MSDLVIILLVAAIGVILFRRFGSSFLGDDESPGNPDDEMPGMT